MLSLTTERAFFQGREGGHKGFSDNFGIKQLEEILANPQFPGKPVNEAYLNLIEVKDGKIIIKDKIKAKRMLQDLRYEIGDTFIDETIEQAGFGDGLRSIDGLKKKIEQLDSELSGLSVNSTDYEKTKGAIETYKKAIEAGGEASYLKKAIIKRRNDIIELFSPLVK